VSWELVRLRFYHGNRPQQTPRQVLWQGRRIHVSIAVEMPPTGVDTPEDLERVERLLRETAA